MPFIADTYGEYLTSNDLTVKSVTKHSTRDVKLKNYQTELLNTDGGCYAMCSEVMKTLLLIKHLPMQWRRMTTHEGEEDQAPIYSPCLEMIYSIDIYVLIILMNLMN